MRPRAPRRRPARRAAPSRRAVLLTAVLVPAAILLAGCSTEAAPGAPALDDVARERAERAEERLAVLLDSHAGYLRDRWPGIAVPEAGTPEWLDASAWPSAYAACLSVRTAVPVVPDGATGSVTLGRPTSDAETRTLELAIFVCESILPPPSIGSGPPGPLELEWRRQAIEVELPRCLLGHGVPIAGGSEGDPYARVRTDPAALARAEALCPDPLASLARIPPAGGQ
ncbi:hypothetical protein OVN18_00580 [Microcella daejeonensis]|uniref:Lipoprotein n=1 Tax=Microcella daejeonensis TaxID=2994971 RepID=A0A9E8ML16_9MICO|nr:hypothetical protein [Microcella daejeonensis]WAB81555.1 hypothetical protein OVN18_00580 [Microcella daejeonensis]